MPRWAIGLLAGLGLLAILGVVAFVAFAAGPFIRRLTELPSQLDEDFFNDPQGSCVAELSADLPFDGPDPGSDATELIQQIAERVEQIRELKFEKPVQPVFLDRDEVTKRIKRLVLDEYPQGEADRDSRALAALGAIEPDTNLRKLFSDALGVGVLGFYDSDTGELVVVRPSGRDQLSFSEQVVLSHELTHALVDQVVGLPDESELDDPGEEDASLAATAVSEGDATLANSVFDQTWEVDDGGPPFSADELDAAQGFAALPNYIQRSIRFPYDEGTPFACHLVSSGGWESLNAAYDKPPTTSAQIMFPERFDEQEAAVDAPDLGNPGEGWELARKYAMGAADLEWLFEAPGDDPSKALENSHELARAWAGGELDVWVKGDDTAAGLSLVERKGESGLCEAVRTWYSRAKPGGDDVRRAGKEVFAVDGIGQDAVISCDAELVRLGIAPDLKTARALLAV